MNKFVTAIVLKFGIIPLKDPNRSLDQMHHFGCPETFEKSLERNLVNESSNLLLMK
jgi:hypothetical protein